MNIFEKRMLVCAGTSMLLGAVLISGTLSSRGHAAGKTYQQIKILVDIMGYISENYVEEMESQKLIYGAASGMVRTLDPFSQFMEPKIHTEMKVETRGEFGGLGIRISIRDKWLTVITPLPGTPAYRLGIMPGDRIIKIEGETTAEITLSKAVEKLRGKPGTKVTITVSRDAEDENSEKIIETKDVTITRAVIKIESVYARMIGDTIGYIRLVEFTKNSAGDLAGHMDELSGKGMKSLVLDLRNNPGGLLSVAVDVCDAFLPKGELIVYTQGRDLSSRQDFKAARNGAFTDIPLIVLVNQGSASGSEIVAGALKDNRRAVVMGARTFGKASVQSVIPLSDGSGLRLTTAYYYTPSGKHIHRKKDSEEWGIEPDISIEVLREVQIKLRMQEELIYEPGKKPHSKTGEEKQVKDEVIERAIQVFKTRDIFQRLETPGDAPAGKSDAVSSSGDQPAEKQ